MTRRPTPLATPPVPALAPRARRVLRSTLVPGVLATSALLAAFTVAAATPGQTPSKPASMPASKTADAADKPSATAAEARKVTPAATDPHSPARVDTRAEPQVLQRVLQDDHIIIEELVVRGQPVRISVRGTAPGARGYEINVGPGGRDASQESGRAGQSAWRLFSF